MFSRKVKYLFLLLVLSFLLAQSVLAKTNLGAGYYFVDSFAQKPAIGINILKIQIFDNKGNKNGSFIIKGAADMPAMPGMGGDEQVFKKNKKNDYFLPFDVSMRGEWIVNLRFILAKKEYAKAKIKFSL